uniref:BLTX755 n=1 Tax=Nephila pilipes TaxID=299642 RepID=A0A076KVK8_NEPPI|nr:BLTX755 [Nephila pilipes]
MLKLLYFKNF